MKTKTIFQDFSINCLDLLNIDNINITDMMLMSYIINLVGSNYELKKYFNNDSKQFHLMIRTEMLENKFKLSKNTILSFFKKMNELGYIKSFIGKSNDTPKINCIIINFNQLSTSIGYDFFEYDKAGLSTAWEKFKYNKSQQQGSTHEDAAPTPITEVKKETKIINMVDRQPVKIAMSKQQPITPLNELLPSSTDDEPPLPFGDNNSYDEDEDSNNEIEPIPLIDEFNEEFGELPDTASIANLKNTLKRESKIGREQLISDLGYHLNNHLTGFMADPHINDSQFNQIEKWFEKII
ncbi:hypothetical protein [Dysgonomonas sp. 520]|uniref:hypothetical protein n=1 Tax=Dysgonomonas sp. 520 TaxID=2302931 RepID=UPI0013D7550F|nr:hypothetical protein [Dysgonomonas sp. 520]NDW10683.1 hypothetical protein [Dysgonomonas sp. 520]